MYTHRKKEKEEKDKQQTNCQPRNLIYSFKKLYTHTFARATHAPIRLSTRARRFFQPPRAIGERERGDFPGLLPRGEVRSPARDVACAEAAATADKASVQGLRDVCVYVCVSRLWREV